MNLEMVVSGEQRLQRGDRVGRAVLPDEHPSQPRLGHQGRLAGRVQFEGPFKRGNRVGQAIQVQQPGGSLQPAGWVRRVDGNGLVHRLHGLLQVAARRHRERVQVGPEELLRFQCLGLRVGSRGRIAESVGIVGHG